MADDGKGGVAFIEDIADITKLKSIRGVTDDVAEAIAKKIDELGLPAGKVDEITEFLADQAKKTDFPVDKLADDISKGSEEFIERIVKEEGLVEAWEKIKYCGDDGLAKLTTDIDELELVASKLYDIEAAGGYKAWKNLPYEGKIAVLYEDYLFYANKAHHIYSNRLPEAIRQIEGIVGNAGIVTGRAKRAESAANRLERAVTNGFVEKINSTEGALDNIWDALGTRITLNTGSVTEVDQVVTNLCNAIKRGELEVVSVNSLAGKGGVPYLTEKHLEQLENASSSVGKSISATPKEYGSGYTVGTVFIKYSDNVRGELQIIGGKTLNIANAEHWVYDAFLGKPYDEYLNIFTNSEVKNIARELIERVRTPATNLTEIQRGIYSDYLNSVYINARKLENGIEVATTPLPSGIPKALSVESLLKTEELLQGLKSGNVNIEQVRIYINGTD